MGAGNVDLLSTAVRVGTSGWSYPAWVGPFYPEGTSAARMLPFYAGSFATVEAHSTHRRTPTAAGLAKWATQVPDGFRFAPKAHVGITHRRDTDGVGDRIAAFATALQPLGDRLGPVLFVLPHRQPDLDRLDRLLDGLDAVPGHRIQAVFELAPPWRTDEVLGRLTAHGASLAVVDREDDNGHAQPRVGPIHYVRLRRKQYSDSDLDRWAGELGAEAHRDGDRDGDRDVYVFVKHDELGDGPRYARDLVRRLYPG